MKRQDLVDALELFDSVGWADDDPTPDFWRDTYQVLAEAARAYLALLDLADHSITTNCFPVRTLGAKWGPNHPSYDEMGQ